MCTATSCKFRSGPTRFWVPNFFLLFSWSSLHVVSNRARYLPVVSCMGFLLIRKTVLGSAFKIYINLFGHKGFKCLKCACARIDPLHLTWSQHPETGMLRIPLLASQAARDKVSTNFGSQPRDIITVYSQCNHFMGTARW